MGIISKPVNFGAGQVSIANDHNQDHDTIYNEFNGNIDDNNIKPGANINGSKLLDNSILTSKIADSQITDTKLDSVTVKLLHTLIAGKKIVTGGKAFNVNGTNTQTLTVTFATDNDDLIDPQFTGPPRISIGPFSDLGAFSHIIVRLKSKTNVSFQIEVTSDLAETGTIDWQAVGS